MQPTDTASYGEVTKAIPQKKLFYEQKNDSPRAIRVADGRCTHGDRESLGRVLDHDFLKLHHVSQRVCESIVKQIETRISR